MARRQLRDACVAGRGMQFVDRRAPGEAPCQSVFPAAAADDERSHQAIGRLCSRAGPTLTTLARHTDQFFDAADVCLRLLRKILERSDLVDLLVPALELLVDRRGVVEHRLMWRHVVEGLSVGAIAGADLEGLEPAEHVELGDQDLAEPVQPGRIPSQAGIEPPASALASRDRAELLAARAETFADVIQQLGRERSRTDPGDVRLHDADHRSTQNGPTPALASALPATGFEDVTNG